VSAPIPDAIEWREGWERKRWSNRLPSKRRRTLFEHQEVACETLGFRWLSEAQRRALVRVLRGELTRTSDRQRLLQFACPWLYECWRDGLPTGSRIVSYAAPDISASISLRLSLSSASAAPTAGGARIVALSPGSICSPASNRRSIIRLRVPASSIVRVAVLS
jgi:hypothetical protein